MLTALPSLIKIIMDPNKILKTDFLDLLFQNRNKSYGAYELRRSYNRRIMTAFGATLAAGMLLFSTSLFADAPRTATSKFYIDSLELTKLQDDPLPVEPPPPPAAVPPPMIERTQFTPPDIVQDALVNEKDIPPDVDMLEDTKIDVVSQAGEKSTELAIPVVDDRKGIVVVKGETASNEPFTKVEVEADFPGGLQAWKKFLERNLSADVATGAGAPAGSYTVVVQFIVDSEGAISAVTANTKHGYGMEEEAVRVIRRSGKWIPAIQNGRPVRAYRKQPVTFLVTEG